MDAAVREGGDAGLPVVISRPESAVARALVAVAEGVAARVSVNAARPASGPRREA
jgi:ATP-binding protein involved in chromosome partitioning